MKIIFNSERGQTLLIVVLVMVVSLTIGLSLVSRSIINLRTTTEEENSQRAFSAAEAGVEQVLKTGVEITSETPLGNIASIKKADLVEIRGSEFLLNGGNTISKDDGVDIWLSNYPDYASPWIGNFTISWGVVSRDSCSDAALEVIILSGSRTSPVTKRYMFDGCSSRKNNNNFSAAVSGGDTIAGKRFSFKTTEITVASGLIARVIPLYASTPIGVKGNIELPLQGKTIESTGIAGGTARKVTFYQGYPELPSEFFGYILFSP